MILAPDTKLQIYLLTYLLTYFLFSVVVVVLLIGLCLFNTGCWLSHHVNNVDQLSSFNGCQKPV